jgi:hypothetical protein
MKISLPNFLKKFSFKKSGAGGAGGAGAVSAAAAGAAKNSGLFDAKRDWKIIIFSFTIVALILAGFSGYLFFKINKGEIFTAGGQNADSTQVIDKKLLEDTVARFEAKKATLLELERQTSVTPDPSL